MNPYDYGPAGGVNLPFSDGYQENYGQGGQYDYDQVNPFQVKKWAVINLFKLTGTSQAITRLTICYL